VYSGRRCCDPPADPKLGTGADTPALRGFAYAFDEAPAMSSECTMLNNLICLRSVCGTAVNDIQRCPLYRSTDGLIMEVTQD